MAALFHRLNLTMFMMTTSLFFVAPSTIDAGEKIIYTPPSRPSHSVPIFERSIDASKLSKLLERIERMSRNQGSQIGGADAIVAHGFMEPVMNKKTSDKLKRKAELNNSWIFAEKEDYEKIESDSNWVASKNDDILDLESMNRDPDDLGIKDSNSDTEDSILIRYLANDNAKAKDDDLSDNGKDDDKNSENDIEESEQNKQFSGLGQKPAGNKSKKALDNQSEWQKLMNRSNGSLNTSLSSESIKPVSSSVSSILSSSSRKLDSGRSVSVTSKSLSDIIDGDLQTMRSSRSRSSLSLNFSSNLRGASSSINTASDESSKIAGPSSLGANPTVETPSNGIDNIGVSGIGYVPTLNLNLKNPPSAVIGQSGGFDLNSTPKTPQPAFKQPTVLSFPKRKF